MQQNDDASAAPSPVVLVVMGVSGSGKTTIGRLLADTLGWGFEEGDNLHPQANIDKMASGHPLDDDDRWQWLDKVAEWIEQQVRAGKNGVITCSALKKSYRDLINRAGSGVEFVYLYGEEETIAARLAVRHGHFMPASLLASQFADLQEPSGDEPFIQVHIGPQPQAIVDTIIAELKRRR